MKKAVSLAIPQPSHSVAPRLRTREPRRSGPYLEEKYEEWLMIALRYSAAPSSTPTCRSDSQTQNQTGRGPLRSGSVKKSEQQRQLLGPVNARSTRQHYAQHPTWLVATNAEPAARHCVAPTCRTQSTRSPSFSARCSASAFSRSLTVRCGPSALALKSDDSDFEKPSTALDRSVRVCQIWAKHERRRLFLR